MTYVTAVLFGFLGFGHWPRFADFVVPALLLYGELYFTSYRLVPHDDDWR